MVSAVSADWSWAIVDQESLALVLPSEQDPRKVSKERFVNLLEFCEEQLGLKRVVAVFPRADLTIQDGFPRTLRYIGFRPLAPDTLPVKLDSSSFFVMSYVI